MMQVSISDPTFLVLSCFHNRQVFSYVKQILIVLETIHLYEIENNTTDMYKVVKLHLSVKNGRSWDRQETFLLWNGIQRRQDLPMLIND